MIRVYLEQEPAYDHIDLNMTLEEWRALSSVDCYDQIPEVELFLDRDWFIADVEEIEP